MSTGLSPAAERDDERYGYLSDLDRAGWAWEFLRRNPDYAESCRQSANDARRHRLTVANIDIIETKPLAPHLDIWGLTYFEDPNRPASEAALFWDAKTHPGVLKVHASPGQPDDPESVDFRTLPCRLRILTIDGIEQVNVSDGRQSVQLDVHAGSVLNGPVRLDYQFGPFAGVDPKLAAIQRFAHLCRTGRFPAIMGTSRHRHHRWLLAVRALDLANSGASQREIAETLFGASLTEQDWRTRSDYLRNRVRRLIRLGHSLSQSGYRQLLSAWTSS